jgi:hypothetical protein
LRHNAAITKSSRAVTSCVLNSITAALFRVLAGSYAQQLRWPSATSKRRSFGCPEAALSLYRSRTFVDLMGFANLSDEACAQHDDEHQK